MTGVSSNRRNIRTDLAIEAREMLMGQVKEEIPGVKTEVEDFDEIHVTRVFITTAEAEQQMGKKQGKYITLEVPGLRQKNTTLQETVSRRFAGSFSPWWNYRRKPPFWWWVWVTGM